MKTSIPNPSDPKRLLFLDDDVELRTLVERYLNARGCRVTLAEELEEAAAILEHRTYDMLCADLNLDGLERLEGLELIEEARRFHPALRIVVQTGNCDPRVHQTCLARGADAVIVKQGSLEPLWQALHAADAQERSC